MSRQARRALPALRAAHEAATIQLATFRAGSAGSAGSGASLMPTNDTPAQQRREASASATTADGGMMAAPTGGDGLRKRFYQRAGIKAGASGLFHVTLDGRVLRTPARNKLLLPHGLALAVAAEWEYQDKKHVRPFTMPLFSMAVTALDLTSRNRPDVLENLIRHLPTDVVCHRHQSPAIRSRQDALHDPLVAFTASRLGARPSVSDAITGVDHTVGYVRRSVEFLAALSDAELTVFEEAARATKSFVLAHNLWEGNVGIEEALTAARVEEDAQIEEWGLVEGGHDIDVTDLRARLAACAVMRGALRAWGSGASGASKPVGVAPQ